MREARWSATRVRRPGNALADPIRRETFLIQDDPAAPESSNVHLEECMSDFQDLCQKNGWDVLLTCPGEDDETVGVLSFAGNFWLLTRSVSMAKEMSKAWLRILNRSHLAVPVEEMEWCHTYAEHIGTLRVRSVLIPCR
eukprot:5129543-Pyramimonas_sp.AAC.1